MRTTVEVIVEVDIDRPPSVVWSFVSDLERLPEWLDEFDAVRKETDGPTGLGSVVRYTVRPGNRSGTLEIVGWDPPRRLAWDGPPLRWARGGARPRGSFEVAAAGEGRARLITHYRPELTGTQVLLAPYLRRWLRRRRLADSQALKTLLEAEAPV